MFRAVSAIFEKKNTKLLALPNVVGAGIGYKTIARKRTKQSAIIVFVEKKTLLRYLNKEDIIPPLVDNVATDVIEIGKVKFFANAERIRPAQPGYSIGHCLVSAGTFGAVVLDSETKEELILSNNHVLANMTSGQDGRSKIGDPILQPGSYDGGNENDAIATLKRYIPLVRGEEEPTCPWAVRVNAMLNRFIKFFKPQYEIKLIKKGRSNVVDCAVASPIKKGLIFDEIADIGKIRGVNSALPYQYVKKSGRSSGLTQGIVIAINVTMRVTIGDEEEYLFRDQIVCDMESLPGDSGSLVVDQQNKAVGLLFAGSDKYTIVNRIQNVMKLLKIGFKTE